MTDFNAASSAATIGMSVPFRRSGLIVSILALVAPIGCTSTNVTPVAANAFVVSTSAAMACGRQGAQRVAFNQAAVETIRRGYDKFVILGGQGGSDIRQVGTTPVYANTIGNGTIYGNTVYASGTTTFSGGDPIYGGTHNQDFVVQVFRLDDPNGTNAIDARQQLGPDWQKKVSEDKQTCF